MPQKSAALDEIYAPIRSELLRVEEDIRMVLAHENAFVSSLLEHSSKFRGKMLRPALLLTSAGIFGSKYTDVHIRLSAVVEILHHATLVHDDVLDEADMRRKVPTMNRTWGNEASVLFGDYLFAKAYTLCAKIHNREANLIFSQTVEDMCVGELTQVASKFNFDIDEARYLEVIRLKTAVLFGTSCRLGSVDSNADPAQVDALAEYGEKFGMAFQIIDDCLDITGDEGEMGKSLGTDLAKGKLTLPVIRLLAKLERPARKQVEELIRSSEDPEKKRQSILDLLLEHEIASEAQQQAQDFLDQAKSHLRSLPTSPLVENLAALADFVLARRI